MLRRCVATLAVLISFLAAFASPAGKRNDGSRSVEVSQAVEILGTRVPPGSYDLRWTCEPGTETVKLEVTRGSRVLASGKGTWASDERPYPREALVYRRRTGANELAEIRFSKSAEWIRVDSSHTVDASTTVTAPGGGSR